MGRKRKEEKKDGDRSMFAVVLWLSRQINSSIRPYTLRTFNIKELKGDCLKTAR